MVKLKPFSLDIKYEIADLKVLRFIEIICFIAKSSEVLLVKEIETELSLHSSERPGEKFVAIAGR